MFNIIRIMHISKSMLLIIITTNNTGLGVGGGALVLIGAALVVHVRHDT